LVGIQDSPKYGVLKVNNGEWENPYLMIKKVAVEIPQLNTYSISLRHYFLGWKKKMFK